MEASLFGFQGRFPSPRKDVRVVSSGEGFFQFFQLESCERGAVPPLFASRIASFAVLQVGGVLQGRVGLADRGRFPSGGLFQDRRGILVG